MQQRTELVDGPLVLDGIVIGNVSGSPAPPNPGEDAPQVDHEATPTVTLNLGWAKAAGVRVVVLADPDIDRNRGGIVLDR